MRQFFSVFTAAQANKSSKNKDDQSVGAALGGSDPFSQIAALRSELVTLHRRTGEVEQCSASNDEFTSLGADELLGQAFMDRLHIADRPACLGAFSKAFHNNERVRVEVRLRCPSLDAIADGFCWVEMMCRAFEAPADEERKVLCISRDISHWKEREQDLIEAQQSALELAERRLRFLDKMSHELRTPLNAIIGFSEMMKLPGLATQNEQQVTQYAGIIHDSGRHLLGVVDEIFEFSQFEAGNYEPTAEIFRVGVLVASSVEFVQSAVQKKAVRLVVGDYNEALEINADQRLCRLALVELLSAQLRHVDAGGKIELSIALDKLDQQTDWLEFRTSGQVGDAKGQPDVLRAGGQLQNCVDLLGGNFTRQVGQADEVSLTINLPQGQIHQNSEKSDRAKNIIVLDKNSKDQLKSFHKMA
ncbi:MAG: PAS domain-containing sensor histidine kinase [Hyphomicrobiaceae bacterium]|nr:PAS domain-containing sensor histidine kinase [Hyphomicrobiaceae bacterium]